MYRTELEVSECLYMEVCVFCEVEKTDGKMSYYVESVEVEYFYSDLDGMSKKRIDVSGEVALFFREHYEHLISEAVDDYFKKIW